MSADLRDGFADRLIRWHKRHGRHDMPWQQTTDPYHVWLSEIMLQQTQVTTVIPYYARFLDRFPTLADLAGAPVEEVMAMWSGLGYYARARNLHKCAQTVVSDHGGELPHSPEQLAALPGIGRSTANSIATFCFNARAPILDGNVKRVFCRHFGIEGAPGSALDKHLWTLVEEHMPARDGGIYNQAQMDLGATICARSKPRCEACPLSDTCIARREGRQAELPTPKVRRVVPTRQASFLVITDGVCVLLETRPDSGIWGGLLALPELAPQRLAAEAAATLSGSPVLAVSPAPTFSHAFSHFRLEITPIVCRVASPTTAMEPGRQWLALNAVGKAALPTPVRKILLALSQSVDNPARG